MGWRAFGRIWAAVLRLYPERQFYYRSRGVVRFITLGAASQMVVTGFALALGGWLAFSTAHMVLRDQIIDSKNQRIAEITEAYQVLAERTVAGEERLLSLTGEVEFQHRQLLELVENTSALDSQLGLVTGQLEAVTGHRDEAILLTESLRQRLAILETDLQTTGAATQMLADSLADAQARMNGLTVQRDQTLSANRSLTRQTADLSQSLGAAQAREGALTQELTQTHNQLAGVTSERDAAVAGGEQLAVQVAELTTRLDENAARTSEVFAGMATAENQILLLDADRADAVGRNQAMAAQVAELTQRLQANTGQTATLVDNLEAAEDQAAMLRFQRDEALQSRDFTALLVDELEFRLAGLQNSQVDLVQRLQVRTQATLAGVEEMILITGLDIDQLVSAAPLSQLAQGGPFVAVGDSPLAADDTFTQSVFLVETQLERWNVLEEILGIIPLASPVDSYYISSNFGMRRDPITSNRAMHNGLDMAGQFKTPLFAPAPGTVTKVGTWGSYGRMVEIDHGFGIVTRYGHLEKTLVKKGDEVGFREQIGLMGNSGRSTGTHLHYEVLFNGIPQDPTKFLKAGQYVFKN